LGFVLGFGHERYGLSEKGKKSTGRFAADRSFGSWRKIIRFVCSPKCYSDRKNEADPNFCKTGWLLPLANRRNIIPPIPVQSLIFMNIPQRLLLHSQRLRLRFPSEADFPHIFSATRYEGFNDGMLWEPPENMEALRGPLLRAKDAWEQGRAYQLTIEQRETQAFLGRIGIHKMEEEGTWEIGFWTHPREQGKGVMTEALGIMLEFGFTQLGVKLIEAGHATWNQASEKVLHKNGMQFVRHIEQGFMKKGQWVAENMLAISREDWEAANK
jgi:ribosomal-protein-alanine N-acetyltransferase